VKGKGDESGAFAAVVAAFEGDRRVQRPELVRGAFGSDGLKVDGKIFAMLVREARRFVGKTSAR
jgi:hypothetical protein